MAVVDGSELEQRARLNYDEPWSGDPGRYTDRAFHDLEVQRLWRHVWQMACRESEVRNVGDFVEYEIAGERILIVRDHDGSLRALSNVCRHRATRLKSGRGNSLELRCPFHGWSYGLDGQLRSIPNDWDFTWLERERFCLPEFLVDVWAGFVFVNLDTDAEPLTEFLAPIPDMVDRYGLGDTYIGVHVSTVLPCNWKFAQDAFLEFYHGPWTHPQTAFFTNEVDTRYDLFGRHSRLCTPEEPSPNVRADDADFAESYGEFFMGDPDWLSDLREGGMTTRQALAAKYREMGGWLGRDLTGYSDEEIIDGWQYAVFPNLIFFPSPNLMGLVFRFRPNGDDQDTSIYDLYSLANLMPGQPVPDDPPEQHFPLGTSFTEILPSHLGAGLAPLMEQDLRNLSGVQQNAKSPWYRTMPLGQYQESRIRRFHEVLDSYLSAEA
jgi:phenylpropionate dioxygenase-like ring-hydroxylating dioxygenase large terminal subunit